ncbi:ROK family protein [Microbacterium aureliae]
MTEVVLAVDIGGTKTAVALIDRAGVAHARAHGATPGREGPSAVVRSVGTLARAALERAPADIVVRGVGVATAGVVDVAVGSIVSSTDTMTGWAGTPLRQLIRDELDDVLDAGAVVSVQNDVDAHALGEVRHGAGAGARSALVVAVGTGVGAGIVRDGAVWRGSRGVAGELGHVPIPGAEHLRCPCGRSGHLEALGSGVGLHRQYLWLGGDAAVTDARAVVALARQGDATAARAVDDSATAVGRATAGAVTLLDPETVIMTGGIVAIGETWWTPMLAALRGELIDALHDIPVVAGSLGGDAPLRGAASTAWHDLEEEDR